VKWLNGFFFPIPSPWLKVVCLFVVVVGVGFFFLRLRTSNGRAGGHGQLVKSANGLCDDDNNSRGFSVTV
jgi:hypothetical protein